MTVGLAYYLLLECEHCDADIHYGVCITLLEHNGLPVITADIGTQTCFDCDECGASNYTGDLDVLVEGGRYPAKDDVDDEYDDEESKEDES